MVVGCSDIASMMTGLVIKHKPDPTRVRQSSTMRRRMLWRVVGVGALAAGAYAIWRAIDANRDAGNAGWEPAPFPPQPRRTPEADVAAWVEPHDATCPASHPVKAKLTSGIYHQPGGASYARTVPDRCYRDADTAAADGLRPAKR
jgi:hypothetical protein